MAKVLSIEVTKAWETFRRVRRRLLAVVVGPGHVSFREIALERRALAPARIAVAAPACALQEKSLARAHLIAARCRGRLLLRGAEPDDEARAAPRFPSGDADRRKTAFVVAAEDRGSLPQLVFALEAQAAAPSTRAARIRHQLETRDAAGKLGFEDFDRRDVQVAEMGRGRGCAVVTHAATIGRSHDLVLHRRLSRAAP